MPKKTKQQELVHEEKYVEFLKTRLASKNLLANATPEEIEKTKVKYDKAKFRLKILKGK